LELRAEALDRRLTPAEFGIALFHTVKRRGYVPAAASTLPDDIPAAQIDELPPGPIVSAATQNERRAAGYRTAGEMLARDPAFSARTRNRQGDYAAVLSRPMVEAEVAALFDAQRRFGLDCASGSLQAEFERIAFHQRPRRLHGRLGSCPYFPEEPMGMRRGPTMERFAFLDALTKIRIAENGQIRRLTPAEIGMVSARFGRTATVTKFDIRRWLAFGPGIRFLGRKPEDVDLVSRLGAAIGTVTLRSILGRAAWEAFEGDPGILDAIANAVSQTGNTEDFAAKLAEIGVTGPHSQALCDAHADGELSIMRGAGRVSVRAAARMIPFLEQGHLVFDAAGLAGLDRLAHDKHILRAAWQPRIYRPVLETAKQVQALIRHMGVRPAHIHVEVAKDLGLTPEQRAAADESYRRTAAARRSARETLSDVLGLVEVSNALTDRYMLWNEQGGRCVYSGEEISLYQLANGAEVQIDHIQPVSRSSDHSRNNTVICLARENQAKGNLTPYEWRGGDADWWRTFISRVRWMALPARKARLLMSRTFADREGSVLNRNLNDTGYVARCTMALLRGLYPAQEAYSRVRARPGQLTAVLRRAWGLSKNRADVRSHALDALMVAVASERTVFELMDARRRNAGIIDVPLPLPWPDFRLSVIAALSDVKVSQSEQRRVRGSGHSGAVRRARMEKEGERVLYERRAVHRLRKSDLARIPDPEINAPLIKALSEWIAAGSPPGRPPMSPQGDPIRHVRIKMAGRTGISKDGLPVRGGIASFGDLVRVDVFCRDGTYQIVPVHAYDVETLAEPPALVAASRKHRGQWASLPPDALFRFSLYRNTLVRITRRNGLVTEGYFRSFEQRSVRLVLSDMMEPGTTYGVAVGQTALIEKFTTDRLGRRYPVRQEIRTWRGGNAPMQASARAKQNEASMVEA
jgi:CRISPR-associated endonuclease Csn1